MVYFHLVANKDTPNYAHNLIIAVYLQYKVGIYLTPVSHEKK